MIYKKMTERDLERLQTLAIDACGWHLWYCKKHDEDVSEQSSCEDWEEDN